MIDNEAIVNCVVQRKYFLKSAQAGPSDWMIEKNMQGSFHHGNPAALTHLQTLIAGKAFQSTANAQPRNHYRRERHNDGSRQQLFFFSSAKDNEDGK